MKNYLAGLYFLTFSTFCYAQAETSPAPSGNERNELSVSEKSVIGHPGKDAGEVKGSKVDFTKGTDAGKSDGIDNYNEDDTSVRFEPASAED